MSRFRSPARFTPACRPTSSSASESRPTKNIEAYTLYLQSQQIGPMRDKARNLAAMELLRKAIALDPKFAVAQARLGYRQIFLGFFDDPVVHR